MKYVDNILNQFSGNSFKLLALGLVLVIFCGSSYYNTYLQEKSCRSVIEENRKLVEGYVEMSRLVRDISTPQPPRVSKRMKSANISPILLLSASPAPIDSTWYEPIYMDPQARLDSISAIIDRNIGNFY